MHVSVPWSQTFKIHFAQHVGKTELRNPISFREILCQEVGCTSHLFLLYEAAAHLRQFDFYALFVNSLTYLQHDDKDKCVKTESITPLKINQYYTITCLLYKNKEITGTAAYIP